MTRWDDVFIAAAGPECLRSPAAGDDIDLVVHAWCGGRSRESRVAERTRLRAGCARTTALQVLSPADGGLAALHVAARYLSASDGLRAALVTAEHAVAPAGAASSRAVSERGATGAVVARGTGAARVLSTVFLGGLPEGAVFRADLPWHEPSSGRPRSGRFSLARWRRTPPPSARQGAVRLEGPEREAVALALGEAGATLSDAVRIVRASDQLAALSSLLKREHPHEASLVVLAGAGRGPDFGCAVLEPV
ncbi:hypothetical protein SSP24_82730 [Streptomyces spinoverrucosus]|uniref:Uncharacterized protein n=1 Tax=Streptomyces spinoverrucosus TaxID=284043 RepID=A0A4Y3VWK8_9ACTN|nr:hypothetical protein [Streptomyces spinoverrucosus]GEC10618.1 hypothetical protein SSP24_82730 [Streptomyces spinoverrucosus]GHB74793.1 hypothetical protein GCM10010397_51690 [Streptomyces spinoverrucosus]